jgi:hypothetical protein
VVCKTLSKPCKTFLGNEVISNTSVGNGVTVAFQIFGYSVEILRPFYQTLPFLIRLFPGTSSPFARKSAPVKSFSVKELLDMPVAPRGARGGTRSVLPKHPPPTNTEFTG